MTVPRRDLEVESLSLMVREFEVMTPEQRARALKYLNDRYGEQPKNTIRYLRQVRQPAKQHQSREETTK